MTRRGRERDRANGATGGNPKLRGAPARLRGVNPSVKVGVKAQKPEARGHYPGVKVGLIWVGGESSPTVVQGETGDRATHEAPACAAQIIPLSAAPRGEFSPSMAGTQPECRLNRLEKAREMGRAHMTTEDSAVPKTAAGGASEAISHPRGGHSGRRGGK